MYVAFEYLAYCLHCPGAGSRTNFPVDKVCLSQVLTGCFQELLEDPLTQHALVAAHADAIQHLVNSCGL